MHECPVETGQSASNAPVTGSSYLKSSTDQGRFGVSYTAMSANPKLRNFLVSGFGRPHVVLTGARRVTAFRHTTTLRRPPAASHPTMTTRSFHPSATAGIMVAGPSRQLIHTHTSG